MATTSFIDPVLKEDVLSSNGKLSRAWSQWLLPFVKRVQFTPINTSGGGQNYVLPLAKKNQNVELIVKKTTGDANTVTFSASTGDTIDNVTALTAVAPIARFISDGTTNWYRIQ